MTNKITGAQHPLKEIFSKQFKYIIPDYQRPYAWTTDEAQDLFDDLYDSFESDEKGDYFLGSIVLIKKESEPLAQIIDGQQRLTTLTILLSALASAVERDPREKLREYISDPGNEFEGIESKPRLTLRRPRDQNFFSKYVQSLNFKELIKLNDKDLENESQINIRDNGELFIRKIEECLEGDEKKIKEFATFLLNNCILIAVSTLNQESAVRIFSVMNNRGLDLQPADILKADIIRMFKNNEDKEDYIECWEDIEAKLGRGPFNELFSHIRMIHAKEKAKKWLVEEFRTLKIFDSNNPGKFINKELDPFAKALAEIREGKNEHLRWLNRIGNSDWMPAAILFLSEFKNEPELISKFFEKLERLAAYMRACALNVNKRIERYKGVLEAIESMGKTGELSPPQAMDLSTEEKKKMLDVLNGNVYGLTSARRNYLILRLDEFVAEGGASYDTKILTIEHVLPQTVKGDSNWAKDWPDEEQRNEWVHRIANLVPLTRSRNSQAQNYDFDKKKEVYFSGRKGVSPYALTTQVLRASQWIPSSVAERQKKLLGDFKKLWDLA